MGRIILSLTGGIPDNPFTAVPLVRLWITVSRLSSALCAVAINFPLEISEKALYLNIRAASSVESLFFKAYSLTSHDITVSGIQSISQSFVQKSWSRILSSPRSL